MLYPCHSRVSVKVKLGGGERLLSLLFNSEYAWSHPLHNTALPMFWEILQYRQWASIYTYINPLGTTQLQVEKPAGEFPIILRSCNCNGYASLVTIGKRESKMCWQHNESTEMGPVMFRERTSNTHARTLGKSLLSYFSTYQSLQIPLIRKAHRQNMWEIRVSIPDSSHSSSGFEIYAP